MIAGAINHNINITISFMFQYNAVFHLKLSERWMFYKVKLTNNVNSLLDFVETKFYEVVLAPPCLPLFLETLISCAPRVIAWCLGSKSALQPKHLTEILLFWAILTLIFCLFASIAVYAGAHSAFRLYVVLVKHVWELQRVWTFDTSPVINLVH